VDREEDGSSEDNSEERGLDHRRRSIWLTSTSNWFGLG
jgi:hypothetical protein